MKKILLIIASAMLAVAAVVTGVILILQLDFKLKTYTVNFYQDENKEVLLQSSVVNIGDIASYDFETNKTPTKASTDDYDYTFNGWISGDNTYEVDTTLPKVRSNIDYVASFISVKKDLEKFVVTFVDEDGTTILDTQNLAKGSIPTYQGKTPSKDQTIEFTYEFSGWTPEITAVSQNTTYKATYSSSTRMYNAKFYDEDGNFDYEYKCVWDNGCQKELKKCEDAKNYDECKNIVAPTNKQCIYINDECKEQYKDCESYNNNGKEQIEQSVCESIILNDYLFNTDKCSFESGNPNKCVRKKEKNVQISKGMIFLSYVIFILHLPQVKNVLIRTQFALLLKNLVWN